MSIGMFDILGPITVGPSSSHTAGAVRIGLVCRALLGGEVKSADITFYGSFAETYKGHGTDKAVLGGLLGFATDNEKIRESLRLAQFRGMQYTFQTAEDARLHPNTVQIDGTGRNEKTVNMQGISVGGGVIRITKLNGFAIDAGCALDTLVVFHKDAQGALAGIAHTLTAGGYNIGNLRLSRTRREGDVITVVETDTAVGAATVSALQGLQQVDDVIAIPKF